MADSITLFQYWRSSSSWRVRWALDYKKIPYEKASINLLQGEQHLSSYGIRQPSHTVPGIVLNGQTFGESLAILEWIEESHPNPPLLPQSLTLRLLTRQLAQTITSSTQPLQNFGVLKAISSQKEQQKEWARKWITRGLDVYESLLKIHCCSGTYSLGSQLTIADLCLIPQCYNARRFGIDVINYSNIARIENNCLALASCQSSAPNCQPDARPDS